MRDDAVEAFPRNDHAARMLAKMAREIEYAVVKLAEFPQAVVAVRVKAFFLQPAVQFFTLEGFVVRVDL